MIHGQKNINLVPQCSYGTFEHVMITLQDFRALYYGI